MVTAMAIPSYVLHPLRSLALAAIRAYQRHVSPHKGYRCAYSVHTGRSGCSGLGYRAIRCKGLFTGLLILRRRLLRCAAVHRQAHPHSDGPYRPYRRPPVAQRGDCDLPCVVTSGGASLDLADATCACVECWSWCDSPKDKSKNKT